MAAKPNLSLLRLEVKTIRSGILLASPPIVFSQSVAPSQSALEYGRMSAVERDTRIAELRQKLAELEARFRTEAHRRGFDPAQIENMALSAMLASLSAECTEVKSELEELAFEAQTGEGLK
jgi:7-keto-8-aminopelargonate synthetase-like enzyme